MRKKLLLSLSFVIAFMFSTKAQNALNFDGIDDFVQTNYSGVGGSADRTFEAWIYVSPNAPLSNLCILDYGLNAVGSRNTFMVSGSRGLSFIAGGTNTNMGSTAGIITSGQWHHVAFVMDNGTGFMYLNGVQVGTGNLSNVNTPSGNADVIIGQRVTGGSVPFNGAIDEVRIWSKARTPAQILANMNSELCNYTNPLAAYFKFNQGMPSGNNSGVTNIIGEIGNTAAAVNFSMIGTSSNWVTGAPIGAGNPLDLTVSMDTTSLTLSANDTSAMTRYQWYDCTANSILTGDTNRTYFSIGSGSFAVIISNGNCTDTSACFNITRVGLDEKDIESNFYLSQNPVEDRFYLINNSSVNINTTVRSITGRIVDKKQNVNQARIDFNLSGVSSGIYILSIESESGFSKIFKIVKR